MSTETPSELEFFEPCLVSLTLYGKVEDKELEGLIDRFEPLVKDKNRFALEVDMREIAGATPEARRLGAERLSKLPKLSVSIITTGFAQRMIAKLVITAVQMLKPGHLIVKFFSDEDSSRAWLKQEIDSWTS